MSELRTQAFQAPPDVDRIQRVALALGGVALLVALVGAVVDTEQFYRSYLLGYIFTLAIPMGCLGLLMIQHLTGGGWGMVTRRTLEAAVRTLPLMALLFVPIALGLSHLYEWTHAEIVATDRVLQWKAPYLNPTFFVIRAVFYFGLWTTMALLLTKWSREQDATGGDDWRLRLVSGPGILLFGLTITLASVDWVMSLDAHWYSTIFGLLFMVSEGLSALAFVILMTFFLSRTPEMSRVLTPKRFHDLGKLLLTFVMLYAYLAFSQFLLIWSANLPEEVTYFLIRTRERWQWLSVLVIVGHFAFPFCLLLLRDLKRQANRLAMLAVIILAMRFLETYWLVVPNFRADQMSVHWLDVTVALGLVGLWLAAFCWNLKGRALLPVGDPYLEEALADGHH
ncbi:MAG: hypothetical protein GEU99_25220 [Luteitalea sp.]|nr:hypothetical protein [Luteitalea sp.]